MTRGGAPEPVRGGRADRTRRRRLLAACSAAALTLSLSAVASAQLPDQPTVPDDPASAVPDPSATAEEATGQQGLDNDLTPQAKESELWRQVGGAVFPRGEGADPAQMVEGSATSFDSDLYDVSFRNERNGIAVGSRCADTPERQEGESDADFGRRVTECARVPAIYQFIHPPNGDPTWSLVNLPGDSQSGYAGAAAWLPDGRALVVGGTGTYPRREPAYRADGQDPGEPYGANQDQAGAGRAWLLQDGRWRELDLDSQLAQGMRGMTALDFHPGNNVEFGAAGALGQIWEWRNGQFSDRIDRNSPWQRLVNRRLFEFRVREIRFVAQGNEDVQAFAVTDGCCGPDPLHNYPRLLAYHEKDFRGPRWFVRPLTWDLRDDVNLDEIRENDQNIKNLVGPDGPTLKDLITEEQFETLYEYRRVNERQDLPDSLYSFAVRTGGNGGTPFCISALASPGGPEQQSERASVLTQRLGRNASGGSGPFGNAGDLVPLFGDPANPLDPVAGIARTRLSTARLVSSDGDTGVSSPVSPGGSRDSLSPSTAGVPSLRCPGSGNVSDPGDGIPDWLAGGLRSTRIEGLGAQALAVATHLRPALLGETVNAEVTLGSPFLRRPTTDELLSGSYEPTTEEKLRGYPVSAYFLLPSYALNSVDIVGKTGSGWAVGDRGAILQVQEKKQQGGVDLSEPAPPRLGARQPRRLQDSSAYATTRPASSDAVGPVPSLATQPTERLPEPRLIPAGSPDPTREAPAAVEDVREIVMSRDGREGWGVGPSVPAGETNTTTSLFHYDGSRWRRCDMLGVRDQLDPDPACASLAGLRRFPSEPNGAISSVRLIAVARVPLERDGDASNDDEFEVVAVGSNYRESTGQPSQPAILRYRDGRWNFEDEEARAEVTVPAFTTELADVAFATPDDGWIMSEDSSAPLFHFDGERWRACGAQSGCDDPDGRLRTSITTQNPGARIKGILSAGDRVYAFGSRAAPNGRNYPLIVYHERGGDWQADPTAGGYDPGWGKAAGGAIGDGVITPDPDQGSVQSLAVTQNAEGAYEGWALGSFGGLSAPGVGNDTNVPRSTMLRLAAGGRWEQFRDWGALHDQTRPRLVGGAFATGPSLQVVLGAGGLDAASPAFIAQRLSGRIFGFNEDRGRWELLPASRPSIPALGVNGPVQAMAPDNQGGFWVAVRNTEESFWSIAGAGHVYFFHYTASAPREVFREAPHPLTGAQKLTALTGAPDGSVWAATDSEILARYDRVTGWERARISGWDPGRVVTRASAVGALAIGPDGRGVAVGEGGRIADLAPDSVSLDRAAGITCDPAAPAPPCGTGRDLGAAAVAGDGSGAAIAAGERLALLWRPPGEEFRAIVRPALPSSTTITGVSMPSADRAYLTTDTGAVLRGEPAGDGWSWRLENELPDGQLLSLDASGEPIALRAVAVDRSGHGYAVGDRGLILERTGGGQPWRRLKTPYLDDLTAVTLPTGSGDGVVIGGRNGLILTGKGDRLETARVADYFSEYYGALTGPVVGLALLPGQEPGQAEAWAGLASTGPGTSRILHYTNDSSEPLLNPGGDLSALPDAPAPQDGELTFAAFGKTDCRLVGVDICPEMEAATQEYEEIARRVREEIAARAAGPGGPAFSLFTGDAVDTATLAGAPLTDQLVDAGVFTNGPKKLRRFSELVADRITDSGVPVFGAIGSQDLSEVRACNPVERDPCITTKEHVKSGDNLAWRQALAGQAAPWGSGAASGGALSFEPVPDGENAKRFEDVDVDADGEEGPVQPVRVPAGGARTHYAVEVLRGGEKVARIVVVDSSLRSLATSDPVQQPLETNAGGQTAWLERMICFAGGQTSTGEACTRGREQRAIVLTNTPTYSYGPGVLAETAIDGTALEQLFFLHDVDVVVSGRLGWNGLYWATAAGLHEPGPGGAYPAGPPPPGPTGESPIPFVVASSAGGKFGPDGQAQGSAAEGFWHGYTLVRLPPNADPTKTVVEQRPVFDWISIEAPQRVVRAGKRLALRGIGREPLGVASTGGGPVVTRYDEISSPAITHRYDLLVADPDRPWLAKEGTVADDCDPYDCLPSNIGTVDRQSGQVRAGNGQYPRTFAVAQLSVGEHSATYPLVFEPRASFRAPALPPPAPVAVPPPPPPPAPANPTTPQVNLPAAPVIPVLTAQALAPPPVPPTPPTFASQAPLDLNLSPAALDVTPPTAVSQPPTPPVNPAPPSGARREARQRQAAAQKSGADSDQESSEAQELGGDTAEAPHGPGHAATRNDFTALAHHEQPSAWARDALIGGGLGIAALLLAIGVNTARPTPRRREPEEPAAAYARTRRR
jgi:hypothetical protein